MFTTIKAKFPFVRTFKYISKPKSFHTTGYFLCKKSEGDKHFRKKAWGGDANLKRLTTDYLNAKYPMKSLGELNHIRDGMLSKAVHSQLAKMFCAPNPSEIPGYRHFRVFLKTFADVNGPIATSDFFKHVVGPKAEAISKSKEID